MAGPATSSSGWIRALRQVWRGKHEASLVVRKATPAVGDGFAATMEKGSYALAQHTHPPRHIGDVAGRPNDGLRHLADQQYQQLNAQLSGEIASQPVHIKRLQGPSRSSEQRAAVPSGGWQMPPTAAATIARMAPILASQVQEHISSTATQTIPRSGKNSPGRA